MRARLGARVRARRAAASVVALLCAVAGLTACQAPVEPSDSAAPSCSPTGGESERVRASGDLFTLPEVTFDAPVQPSMTQRTVLVEGSGPVAEVGDMVAVEFVAFNGRSGEVIETTGYGADGIGLTLLTLDVGATAPGLRRALVCSAEGSRVVAVVHPDDGVGAAIGDAVAADDPLVYVVDVVSVAQRRASGEVLVADGEPAAEGMPVVDGSGPGAPGVGVPPTPAPAELIVETLIEGAGPAVREGSDVVFRHRSVLWRNGFTVAENWSVPRVDPVSLSALLPGVREALVGATVGSRVLVVVPPEQGFGRLGDPASSVTGTDTLVFVIDVLATT